MRISTPFTEHPASVGESYTGHMRVALGFAGSLAVASGAALVHAVVPSLCQTTASRRIRAMHETISTGARGAAHERHAETSAAERAA